MHSRSRTRRALARLPHGNGTHRTSLQQKEALRCTKKKKHASFQRPPVRWHSHAHGRAPHAPRAGPARAPPPPRGARTSAKRLNWPNCVTTPSALCSTHAKQKQLLNEAEAIVTAAGRTAGLPTPLGRARAARGQAAGAPPRAARGRGRAARARCGTRCSLRRTRAHLFVPPRI